MLDPHTGGAGAVAEEFRHVIAHSWSSKRMLQLIRRKALAVGAHANPPLHPAPSGACESTFLSPHPPPMAMYLM